MDLLVMNIDTKQSKSLFIRKDRTLGFLKEELSKLFGINKQEIVVHHGGTMYHNEVDYKTLEELKIDRVIKIHKFEEAA